MGSGDRGVGGTRGQLKTRGFDLPPSIKIIHEDQDLIVVDKPPGLLTAIEPDAPFRDNLFDFLKKYVRATRGWPKRRKPGDEAPRAAGQGCYIIHRLDKDASGLLVFATSEKAFTWLKNDFKAKRVHRIYTALCEGIVGEKDATGTIQSFLKDDAEGVARSIKDDEFRGAGPGSVGGIGKETAKLAVTHYRVLAAANNLSLVQVRLDTGRKNQIRVHLGEKGHPICGDYRYGAKTDPAGRLTLHASELGFTHPASGQSVKYISPAAGPFYRSVGLEPPAGPECPEPGAAPVRPPARAFQAVADTAWENVAGWYDRLQAEGLSDHYTQVIIPGAVRLVQPKAGMSVLDVACGQGVVSRALADLGAAVVGVDAAPSLVEAAKGRGGKNVEYFVGDVRALDDAALRARAGGGFDAAVCIMALTNLEPIEPVLRGVSGLLKPGGRLVIVISHPAFRAPKQTSWGWDPKDKRQFRRVDGYLSPGQSAIEMQPGKAATAGESVTTITFHRPLQHYVRLLGESGLLIETLEEWPGQRRSEPGPKAEEENRARREIPLFLAIRCRKVEAS